MICHQDQALMPWSMAAAELEQWLIPSFVLASFLYLVVLLSRWWERKRRRQETGFATLLDQYSRGWTASLGTNDRKVVQDWISALSQGDREQCKILCGILWFRFHCGADSNIVLYTTCHHRRQQLHSVPLFHGPCQVKCTKRFCYVWKVSWWCNVR
jgi:hypothetical protein